MVNSRLNFIYNPISSRIKEEYLIEKNFVLNLFIM